VNSETDPTFALFAGTRMGILVPYGGLYADRALVTTPFQDVATAGPALELDFGARFAHRFAGYIFFEQALLGRGNSAAWTAPHGGQSGPSTQALGLGLRWESNPDGLGLVADVALGYRWLTARWGDGTTLRMQGPGEVRLGLGASWRVTPVFILSPMVTAFTGAFTSRTLDGAPLGDAVSSYAGASVALSGYVEMY
jgi:hypothetical protein